MTLPLGPVQASPIWFARSFVGSCAIDWHEHWAKNTEFTFGPEYHFKSEADALARGEKQLHLPRSQGTPHYFDLLCHHHRVCILPPCIQFCHQIHLLCHHHRANSLPAKLHSSYHFNFYDIHDDRRVGIWGRGDRKEMVTALWCEANFSLEQMFQV